MKLTYDEKVELLQALETLDKHKKENRRDSFYSTAKIRAQYPKAMEFFEKGSRYNQRLFMASNRSGKTISGAYEITCHATGIYPDWWKGKRFDEPVLICCAGVNSKTVRDVIQKELLGTTNDLGSGMIPKKLIVSHVPGRGLSDAIDNIDIQHKSGGRSIIYFKSYEQGRRAFEGTIFNIVWCDEEPPNDIVSELLTRTATVEGIMFNTFTPLLGPTPLIVSFMNASEDSGRTYITQTWDDVPHLTDKVKKELLASYPAYQRDARSKGIPQLGSGAIYPISEETFVIEPIAIPKHWKRIYGLDVGWNNTAACWIAVDQETDTMYVYSDYKRGQAEPFVHAQAIKARGTNIPGVIDPASMGSNQIDGRQVKDMYTETGLILECANNAVEAGIYEVWTRLSTGRLKIFKNCSQLLEEFRLYRRDEKGKIVKSNDHIMDAMRYAVMTVEFAKTEFDFQQQQNEFTYHPNINPMSHYGLR